MNLLAHFLALTAAGAGLVASQPHIGHHHGHAHFHQAHADKVKRIATPVVVTDTAVATVYVLDGSQISPAEVQQGIANGTLMWADDGGLVSSAIPAQPSATALTQAQAQAATPSSSAAAPAYTSPDAFSPDPVQPSTTQSSSGTTPTSGGGISGGTGVNADFPDGQLSCSDFPDEYGALALDYLGLGGWSGIQSPGSTSVLGFSDIMTVIKSACSGSNCCSEGMFCSYACPAGYQKSQWPSTQGATGQSVGGIQCKNGKLWLTNKSLSNKLCMTGSSAVQVQVQNKMSQKASVCRTDYPGTEGETIPLDAKAGSTTNLTCPDASQYYVWQGKSTSAQYYVNPKGVGVEEACQWGDPSDNVGNYAPMNLGVGYSDGSAYISVFQNLPTTSSKLDFTVEVVGDNGGYDNLSGRCKYSNGQYCSGDNYQTCSSTTGCTVSASSGTMTFVFTD